MGHENTPFPALAFHWLMREEEAMLSPRGLHNSQSVWGIMSHPHIHLFLPLFLLIIFQNGFTNARKCSFTFNVHGRDAEGMCTNSAAKIEGIIGQNDVYARQPVAESGVDKDTAKDLLVAVTKLMKEQNMVQDVKVNKENLKDLKQQLTSQKQEQAHLQQKYDIMQEQIQLLVSGQKDREKEHDKLFVNYGGVTNRYQGCPVHNPVRIHEIAPLRIVEEQTIRLVPRSCLEWKKQGHKTQHHYTIDPDGLDGEDPFQVECLMSDPPVTVVRHDQENRHQVTGHEEPGSYKVMVNYKGASMAQVRALVSTSIDCRQFLKYECKGSTLDGMGWWLNHKGNQMPYWAGGVERGCACYANRTCTHSGYCNCDANYEGRWLEDSGYISDLQELPVSQLQFGDTGNEGEEGYFSLGPLRCISNKTNTFEGVTALLPVKTWPPFSVYCDYEGWMVIQRKSFQSSVDFDRTWADYKRGFGDLYGDFWLGLDHLHHMTNQDRRYMIHVSLKNGDGKNYEATYSDIKVGSERDMYRLSIGAYKGSISDQLSSSGWMPFTTKDKDNDGWRDANCAQTSTRSGGWWYSDCGHVYVNSHDMLWGGIIGIQKVELKIKVMP